jgi:hypothetical protein
MFRARLRFPLFFALLALVACACLAAACAKPGTEHTYLQADDLQGGATNFDHNEILDTPSFTDARGVDATQLQRFLAHTPYKRPSFLATYQSNGVRAVDSVMVAAAKYGINPLVFLVRAEVDQGLVGEQFYPQPPSRVEYVFGCGCPGVGACDPRLAGFDVQVDCLGRALRRSLDAIATDAVTEGGFGPGVESTTLDGVKVTPHDEATAALYQYTPKVGFGSSGNWLFWHIWQNYALGADYVGPIGPSGQTSWIGDACKTDPTCGYAGGICATNYPGGLCTAPCTTDCPADTSRVPTFCASFQQAGYCLAVCNPSVAASCRDGYTCKKVQRFGNANESQNVCVVP